MYAGEMELKGFLTVRLILVSQTTLNTGPVKFSWRKGTLKFLCTCAELGGKAVTPALTDER